MWRKGVVNVVLLGFVFTLPPRIWATSSTELSASKQGINYPFINGKSYIFPLKLFNSDFRLPIGKQQIVTSSTISGRANTTITQIY